MNDALQSRVDRVVALTPAVEVATSVTVVMVVYRTGEALSQSIDRVLRDPDVDEFVLIDNGSSVSEAAVIDRAAEDEPRMTVIRGHGNIGFARAVNMGASIAKGEVIVVLNPDAFLEKGCVRALHKTLRSCRVPALVGARVLNVDGTEQRGARRGEVTPITSILSLTGLTKRVPALHSFEVHHEDDPTPMRGISVPTISGACFAMRRADFMMLGGMDVGYFLHVEDVDLCWRVRQAKGEVLFEPRARVVHLGSTSQASPLMVEYWKGVGLARYFRKRADDTLGKLVAVLLTPLIVAVSVARPLIHPGLRKKR